MLLKMARLLNLNDAGACARTNEVKSLMAFGYDVTFLCTPAMLPCTQAPVTNEWLD